MLPRRITIIMLPHKKAFGCYIFQDYKIRFEGNKLLRKFPQNSIAEILDICSEFAIKHQNLKSIIKEIKILTNISCILI